MLAGFFLALLLNVVLGAQMYAFWGNEEERDLGKSSVREKGPLENIVVPPQSPLPPRQTQTPPPGARRWARKLD
jgi:mannose-P-dolichol utilization defect protein 1